MDTITAMQTSNARTARLFHALSDETRLRIVDILQRGECCVCDLQGSVGAAQSRLSFHLKVLREAGLVNDRKQGRWNYYSLRPEALEELVTYLEERKPEEASRDCGCAGAGAEGCCG